MRFVAAAGTPYAGIARFLERIRNGNIALMLKRILMNQLYSLSRAVH
jgi:hypothetical protein